MPGDNPVKVLDVAPMVYFVPLNTMSYIVAVCTGFQHKNEGMYKKAIKGVDELYDHIMLEIVRITDHKKNLDRINEIIDQFKQESTDSFKKQDISLIQTVAEFENRFREADKLSKKLKKKVNNVYSQFVSILGIFTAIVIVFFGGVSVFSDVLTNIHQAEWYQIGFGISFVGIVMFDIIFMFLYILSKLVGMPISTKEESDKKIAVFRWIDKYPYLFWFNFLCFIIMFICA